jgi:transcriptional regulator with XRE-family HTH domain
VKDELDELRAAVKCVDKNCQQAEGRYVNVVGQRLKSFRIGKGLSLREFAKQLDEDFSLLWRIEHGERHPPRSNLEKFAKLLSLTPAQLDALIAVERRGLNPHLLLPEIAPAHIPHDSIEDTVEDVLKEYCRAAKRAEVEIPVPVEAVLAQACHLSVERCNFKKKKIPRPASLYGCLYPDGFEGKDRMVFINTGLVRGRKLLYEEQRTTAAHEAGHYVLHCGNTESAQLFFRFSKAPTFCREAECEEELFNPLEYQASVFAACLLMPQKQFKREWLKSDRGEATLAKAFEVTESFVRFRVKMLRL